MVVFVRSSVALLVGVFAVFAVSLVGGSDPPPNIDQVTHSYNLFLGETPFEQRDGLVGEQLFRLTNTDLTDDGIYIRYDQIDDMSTNAGCFYEEKANEVYWATSSQTLQKQSIASSDGYDQQSSIGVSGESVGIPITAETSIRNALVFSNSKTSINQQTMLEAGYTYTFDASANRQLYSVEVDWDSLDSSSSEWSDDILNHVSALGSNPSTTDIFEFIRDVGTHGLDTAVFGQICVTAAFMEGGYTSSEYYYFNQDTSANEAGFVWWTSSNSMEETNSGIEQFSNSFRYQYGNKYCRGELDHGSSCGGGMSASGVNLPAITRWTYKPIWEMDIPMFSDTAKNKLKQVFTDIYVAGYDCRNNHCNGHGQCGTKPSAWSVASFSSTSYAQFWDGDKCFCDDHYEGNKCNRKSDIILSSTMTWSGYKNKYDEILDYTAPFAICGMESVHDNGKEDRRFGFQECRPQQNGFFPTGNTNTIGTTDYNEEWSLYCDSDKILKGLKSWHDNGKEDRRFEAYCRKLKGLTTENCKWTGYKNSFDNELKDSCPPGKILHGLNSYHDNSKEDRRFKFRCCDLVREDAYRTVKRDDWTGYQNNWDASHTSQSFTSDKVFCGVSSIHDNQKEDRRVRFKYCRPNNGMLTSHTDWSSYSNWDSFFSFTCPSAAYFITNWNSFHDNGKEDRRYRFRCAKYKDADASRGADDCVWTPYVEKFDAKVEFTCGDGQAINGVKSYHSNKSEDRRFAFRCCRIKVPV